MEKIAELKAMFAEGTPSRAEIEAAVSKFGRGFLSNICGKGYEMDDEEENKRSRLIFGEEEDLPPLPPRVDAGFYVPVAVPPSAPSAASSGSSSSGGTPAGFPAPPPKAKAKSKAAAAPAVPPVAPPPTLPAVPVEPPPAPPPPAVKVEPPPSMAPAAVEPPASAAAAKPTTNPFGDGDDEEETTAEETSTATAGGVTSLDDIMAEVQRLEEEGKLVEASALMLRAQAAAAGRSAQLD